MKNKEMELYINADIGTSFQLTIPGLAQRMSGGLIGIDHQKYLIIKPPAISTMDAVNMRAMINKKLMKKEIDIKYMHDGIIYVFSSSLMTIIIKPALLLFFSYPKEINQIELRDSKRKPCILPVTFVSDSKTMEGTIINISESGCRSIIEDKIPANVKLKLGKEIGFYIFLPKMPSSVLVNGIIRYISSDQSKVEIGIEFTKGYEIIFEKIGKHLFL